MSPSRGMSCLEMLITVIIVLKGVSVVYKPHQSLTASSFLPPVQMMMMMMKVLAWVLHLLPVWMMSSSSAAADFSVRFGNALPSLSRPANSSQIFYGIMFDAGSTGTRIHVYTFIQKDPGQMTVTALHTIQIDSSVMQTSSHMKQIQFLHSLRCSFRNKPDL